MKILTFIIFVLFLAAALALLALDDPGYVLIARTPWSVEMTLVVFIALLLVSVASLYTLWHVLVRVWKTPAMVSEWRQVRRTRRARAALSSGLVFLVEGSWLKAEKQLLSSLRDSEMPLLNYLGAAYSAQQHGDIEKRDEFLSLAHQNAPDQGLTVGMMQAQLQYQARQFERALATLAQLRVGSPKHPHAMYMLALVYRELRDWESLANLIPELRRAKAVAGAEIDDLERHAHRELLALSPPAKASGALKQTWNAIPSALRHKPEFIALYARQLIAQGAMDECEALISNAMDNSWSDDLARLYGLARSTNPAAQLETAEAWLQTHPDNTHLLLALGRLARHNKLNDKARTYLERAVALYAPLEASFELGALLEQSGERERAMECYRKALARHADEAVSSGGRRRATDKEAERASENGAERRQAGNR